MTSPSLPMIGAELESVSSSRPSAVSSPSHPVQLAFMVVKVLPLPVFNGLPSGPPLPSRVWTPAAAFPPAHPGLSLAPTGLCPKERTDAYHNCGPSSSN